MINKKQLSIFLILLFFVFIGGYIVGTYVTIKAVADITKGFIDKELIEYAIFQYKEQMGGCFPSKLNFTI